MRRPWAREALLPVALTKVGPTKSQPPLLCSLEIPGPGSRGIDLDLAVPANCLRGKILGLSPELSLGPRSLQLWTGNQGRG